MGELVDRVVAGVVQLGNLGVGAVAQVCDGGLCLVKEVLLGGIEVVYALA